MKKIKVLELQNRIKSSSFSCKGIKCDDCIFCSRKLECSYLDSIYDFNKIKYHKFKQKEITIRALNKFNKCL